MNTTKPKVYLIAATEMQPHEGIPGLYEYLDEVGASPWTTDTQATAEVLTEAAGRLCYRSWKPGLNPNVAKVREGNREYLDNILRQRHGSVMEHSSVSFIFRHVSRVFTHELVRHRVGVGISQESMRYVRLDREVPLVLPEELGESVDNETRARQNLLAGALGDLLDYLSKRYQLDDPKAKFSVKKAITSAMRRFVPMGVATDILWTANIRTKGNA